MTSVLYLLLSPLWAATGCYPKRLLAEKPVVSFRIYSACLILLPLIHHGFTSALTGNAFYLKFPILFFAYLIVLVLIVFCLNRKWQVAAIMALVGKDLIFFATGFQSSYFATALVVVYLGRELFETHQLKKADLQKLP